MDGRYSRRRVHFVLLCACCLVVLIAPGVADGQVERRATKPSPADPSRNRGGDGPDSVAVCSYLTGRLRADVPGVPTLCQPVAVGARRGNGARPAVVVSVFSPSEVLEGEMRRAWSTALFQAVQALFFQGSQEGVCG